MRKSLIAGTLLMAGAAVQAAAQVPASAPAASSSSASVPLAEAGASLNSTPQDDLGCAFWTAAMVGNLKDGEMKNGASMAMVWFIGRWEGATGRPIEDGMTVANLATVTPQFKALAEQCPQRMIAFGGRMQALGAKLQAFGKAGSNGAAVGD